MVVEASRRMTRRRDGFSDVDINKALRLLADPLCRPMLTKLALQPTNSPSYDELVDSYVVSHQEVEPVERVSIEIQCHHWHFPALEEAGMIEYDETSREVQYYTNPYVESVLAIIDQRG